MIGCHLYTDEKIYKGSVGIEFRVQILSGTQAADISSASNLQLAFRSPSGVETIRTASFLTDGTDGWIKYVSKSGDLDEAGDWTLQPILTGLGAFTGRTSWSRFPVLPNIGDLV